MFPLLAAVIAIAVIVWMWRFLDNEVSRRDDDHGDVPRPAHRSVITRRPTAPTKAVAPDDDPEFLRELGRRIGKNRDDKNPA
ncbi:hypothetical protein [Cumulibacter manganitolerans]|uniref:hypothetical protein n=1 Tax=Cumulibacter manganitolerans TaxID=1884992 RepID=UPI0012976B84|nr:hypothetical protein [Cumulibacter manganitolerans]